MREGVQSFFAELGEAACLALCICELGKPGLSEAEAVSLILQGIEKGFIDYRWQDRQYENNLFVSNRDAFMNLVTGQDGWKSRVEPPSYTLKAGELAVSCWEWRDSGTLRRHFRLADWDPILDSQTVRHGALASLRVFRKNP